MRERIEEELSALEVAHDVVILYACESGSRAWGFASTDSDYDVRFVYLRRPDWYLSVDLGSRRDVIERPIDHALDIGGWDLRKALLLFRKSNPPLLEWLGSPIVYREVHETESQLRALSSTYCAATVSGYHYLHMAQGNFREFLKGREVRLKKYFYVLRPVLAVKWLEAGKGVVPMEFQRLVDASLPQGELRDAITELTAQKAAGAELDRGPKIPVISEFLEVELERLSDTKFDRAPALPSAGPLNTLFVETLDTVFGTALKECQSSRRAGSAESLP